MLCLVPALAGGRYRGRAGRQCGLRSRCAPASRVLLAPPSGQLRAPFVAVAPCAPALRSFLPAQPPTPVALLTPLAPLALGGKEQKKIAPGPRGPLAAASSARAVTRAARPFPAPSPPGCRPPPVGAVRRVRASGRCRAGPLRGRGRRSGLLRPGGLCAGGPRRRAPRPPVGSRRCGVARLGVRLPPASPGGLLLGAAPPPLRPCFFLVGVAFCCVLWYSVGVCGSGRGPVGVGPGGVLWLLLLPLRFRRLRLRRPRPGPLARWRRVWLRPAPALRRRPARRGPARCSSRGLALCLLAARRWRPASRRASWPRGPSRSSVAPPALIALSWGRRSRAGLPRGSRCSPRSVRAARARRGRSRRCRGCRRRSPRGRGSRGGPAARLPCPCGRAWCGARGSRRLPLPRWAAPAACFSRRRRPPARWARRRCRRPRAAPCSRSACGPARAWRARRARFPRLRCPARRGAGFPPGSPVGAAGAGGPRPRLRACFSGGSGPGVSPRPLPLRPSGCAVCGPSGRRFCRRAGGRFVFRSWGRAPARFWLGLLRPRRCCRFSVAGTASGPVGDAPAARRGDAGTAQPGCPSALPRRSARRFPWFGRSGPAPGCAVPAPGPVAAASSPRRAARPPVPIALRGRGVQFGRSGPAPGSPSPAARPGGRSGRDHRRSRRQGGKIRRYFVATCCILWGFVGTIRVQAIGPATSRAEGSAW